MGNFGGDGEDGGGDTHWVSESDHGETGEAEIRRDMGDYQGASSARSGGNQVGYELHRNKTWDGGTVGGAGADFRGGARETGYERGGRRRGEWFHQEAAET